MSKITALSTVSLYQPRQSVKLRLVVGINGSAESVLTVIRKLPSLLLRLKATETSNGDNWRKRFFALDPYVLKLRGRSAVSWVELTEQW